MPSRGGGGGSGLTIGLWWVGRQVPRADQGVHRSAAPEPETRPPGNRGDESSPTRHASREADTFLACGSGGISKMGGTKHALFSCPKPLSTPSSQRPPGTHLSKAGCTAGGAAHASGGEGCGLLPGDGGGRGRGALPRVGCITKG